MSSCDRVLAALALACAAFVAHAQPPREFTGIGRAATPQEVAAWDIAVRPDFKGLPAGAGSVAKGQQVWEGKCASCHGVFGESNEVFQPLVGGTTAQDIRTGRVASLTRNDYPGRTTLMKLTSVSTLWDYINRAMPWNQPKSLSVEEVYAVTAFMLNLGGIVPDDFTLSERNIREVQQRIPNRNGGTTLHALWPGRELGGTARPDVTAAACMKDCTVPPAVSSILPAFARNAHGNLAQQNRLVGGQRGADTTQAEAGGPAPIAAVSPTPAPTPAAPVGSAASATATAGPATDAPAVTASAAALLQKNNCNACHAANSKLVGPAWAEIAKKHPGNVDYLAGKIRAGGSGAWGAIPMPPQSLSQEDAKRIAAWLAAGAAQ